MENIKETEVIKSLKKEIKRITGNGKMSKEAENLLLQAGIAGIKIGLEEARKIYNS